MAINVVISRAFQVLSDPDKRAIFDQHGGDPDSRSAGMASSGFSNGFPTMRTYGRGDDLSPDELFNLFFGGSSFGGGTFNGDISLLNKISYFRTIWTECASSHVRREQTSCGKPTE